MTKDGKSKNRIMDKLIAHASKNPNVSLQSGDGALCRIKALHLLA